MLPSRFKPGDRFVFILLGLLSSIIIISAYAYRPWFLEVLDLKASDAMTAARPAIRPPAQVAVVTVDEKSVNELGRWPWRRDVTARLIGALKPARTVALDMVFSEETGRGDAALSEAIKGAGNVVSGFFFRNDSNAAPDPRALAQVRRSAIGLIRDSGGDGVQERPFLGHEFSSLEANTALIGKWAAGYGAFNIIPQRDGLYRAAHLVFMHDGRIYPSLPLAALSHYYGGEIVLYTAPYGIDGASIKDAAIPLDEEGAFSLSFYGKGGSFTEYSATDVINGRIRTDEIKDKLVFVGVTEKAVYDIRPVPKDSLFPGVEIHATVAGNIIEKRFLIRDTRAAAFDLSLTIVMPLLLSVIISRVGRTFTSLAVFTALAFILVAGSFLLFSFHNVRTGVVFPALSLLLSYLSGEAYRNIVVEKRNRYLRKAFSTYVSTQLVSEILKDPARLKLGGEKRDVSVLFSDIRGFTTISERLEPEELVALLNEYLNPMTGIILKEEGMLDKYIGDAIMAVFNAPLPIRDHPRRACMAALEMKEKLKGLNGSWRSRGRPELEIGIGINTGKAVVGNMGAEFRFDYTAIGDTVNLASRLEGMTKIYGADIIVSEYTYDRVKDVFLFREIDLVRVKGKDIPIKMFELMGGDRGDERGLELSRAFSRALSVYREKRFEDAKALFESILESFPGDRPSRLYVKRCSDFIREAPPEGWDGVFAAKSK